MDFLISNNIVADYSTDNIMLFNADCTDILSNIRSESIDLFVADIPYKISKKGIAKRKPRN